MTIGRIGSMAVISAPVMGVVVYAAWSTGGWRGLVVLVVMAPFAVAFGWAIYRWGEEIDEDREPWWKP